MTVSTDAPSPDGGLPDPEAVLDRLVELGAVTESEDGSLATTSEYEDVRRVYHDTYAEMDDDGVESTVADLFGVERAEAASLLDAGEVTRADVIAYLAARSFADGELDSPTLAVASDLLVRIEPETPVPEAFEELTDDSYRSFLDSNPDAVVTVWRHHCDPCEAMKADVPEILDAVPEGVATAGLDGQDAPAFRREFGVDAAPAVLLFCDGERRETLTGRRRPETFADRFADVFGDS
ncbi:Thiol-disulfide isomerase or thioredoxin [Halopelagius inordinatus]|uniref:Thiol-disulfide isomerase or thioredoxin n=1 Tax=Halopelagius inordinatus TaxID=553467 RepID=A0A1I2N711_9EURY|nr:Thiol-disulfide isomerase or thioredoxin [Halopelagius inordinatus]